MPKKSFFYKVLIPTLVILAILFFFFNKNIFSMEKVEVIESIKHQDFSIATGSISAIDDVTLVFEEKGTVDRVLVSSGDSVKIGELLISLNKESLQAEVNSQISIVKREQSKLDTILLGADIKEKESLDAVNEVARQELENANRSGTIEAQKSAAEIENLIDLELDNNFFNSNNQANSNLGIFALEAQEINSRRSEIDKVIKNWREWSVISTTREVDPVDIITSFVNDLQKVNAFVVFLYDSLGEGSNSESLEQISKARIEVLTSISINTENLNKIKISSANYKRTIKESTKTASGGTEEDASAQRAQLESEKQTLNKLNVRLKNADIVAPFTGIVGEVFVEKNEYISEGTEAARLISSGGYEINVEVTEIDIFSLEVGQVIEAEIESTTEKLEAIISNINLTEKKVDDIPVYEVTFQLKEAGANLRSGLTVDTFIPINDLESVLTVSNEAILLKNRGGGEFISVRRGNRVVEVEIKAGLLAKNGKRIIVGDVREGEEVVYFVSN